MKLPVKGTRAAQVLDLLYAGQSCTIGQAIGRHADFGLSPSSIISIYERLVATACADLQDGIYSISKPALRYFDQLAKPAEESGAVAGPAYRPAPKPLDVSRTRMVMTREGALDYRNVPSLVGSARVAFKGGRPEDADGGA